VKAKLEKQTTGMKKNRSYAEIPISDADVDTLIDLDDPSNKK
jgi:hypothetical protein